MRIAVATHSLLLVVELDDDWRILDIQVVERGYHYGMALKTGAAGDSRLIVYRGGRSDSEQDEMELRTYDGTSLQLLESRPLDESFGAVHQIAWANGGLYVANTKKNKLSFLADESGRSHSYTFGGVEGDIHHVNSVFPCNEEILSVLHNRHKRESELAVLLHRPDSNLTLLRRLPLWDVCCHNVFIDGPLLLYNASTARRLVIADIIKGRIIRRIGFGGHHTKALSVSPAHVLVGLSEHTVRRRRRFSKGFIGVLDRDTFETRAVIDLNSALPHPLGNINEIRCLDGSEAAHSREATSLNWDAIRLARERPLPFWSFRLKTLGMIPLRRVKQVLSAYLKRG